MYRENLTMRNEDLQTPLFTLDTDWEAPNLDELPDWSSAEVVGIDTETCDTGIRNKLGIGVRFPGSFVAGISFCLDGDKSYYLPVRHEGGGNLDEAKVWKYLIDQAGRFTGTLVGMNIKYDLDYLQSNGVVFPNVYRIRDVMVNAPLIYELDYGYSLDKISKRLGFDGKDEDLLRRACSDFGVGKADMWRLPAKYVGPYAEYDAELPILILRKQEKVIFSEGLDGIYDLESRLIPVLCSMTVRGVKIDVHKLAWIDDWAKQTQESCLEEIACKTGIQLGKGDCTTTSAVLPLLKHLGIKAPLTADGNPSVTIPFLERYESDDLIKTLLRARRFDTISNTFVKPTIKHLVGDRIHCTFHQLRSEKGGTITGRLSASDTNLQNQPARDPEIAPIWRSIYLPDKEMFCGADYSQQEPRIMVHYAEACRDKFGNKFKGAEKAGNSYRENPDTDFHQMMADMTGLPRKQAKGLFLGMVYGMGGGKLCETLGLPVKYETRFRGEEKEHTFSKAGDEGESIIKQFHQKVPFVRQLVYKVQDRVKQEGSLRTLLGRRRNFPLKDNGSYDWLHKALNSLVQGSAADQTKMAMVSLADAGFDLQLQVHDEVDLSIDTIDEGREVKHIMENCAPLSVPSKVDLEVGRNWGEVQEIE